MTGSRRANLRGAFRRLGVGGSRRVVEIRGRPSAAVHFPINLARAIPRSHPAAALSRDSHGREASAFRPPAVSWTVDLGVVVSIGQVWSLTGRETMAISNRPPVVERAGLLRRRSLQNGGTAKG